MIAIIFVSRVPELDLTLLAAIYERVTKQSETRSSIDKFIYAFLISNNILTSYYSQYDIEQRPHFIRGFGAFEAGIPH